MSTSSSSKKGRRDETLSSRFDSFVSWLAYEEKSDRSSHCSEVKRENFLISFHFQERSSTEILQPLLAWLSQRCVPRRAIGFPCFKTHKNTLQE